MWRPDAGNCQAHGSMPLTLTFPHPNRSCGKRYMASGFFVTNSARRVATSIYLIVSALVLRFRQLRRTVVYRHSLLRSSRGDPHTVFHFQSDAGKVLMEAR